MSRVSPHFVKFHFQIANKTREMSRKWSDIVQIGGWRDSSSSAPCSVLEQALSTNERVRYSLLSAITLVNQK